MKLSKEILCSLRGRQSARAFSEKLGYPSNQISRWESGHSRFAWTDFLDLCQRLNFPLNQTLSQYEFYDGGEDVQKLFFYLMPNKSKNEMAKACGVSVLTLQRWYKGKFSPNADLVFKLFTKSGTPLSLLLKQLLVKKKMTPKMVEFLAQENESIAAMMEAPWTIAIACRSLQADLQDLKYDEALRLIADKLQTDLSIVSDTVHRLIHAKLLGFSEKDLRFYLPEGPAHFEFRDSYEAFVDGAKFWMEYSLSVLNHKKTPAMGENHFSYLVFNLRSSEVKKVHEKIAALYKEIAAMSQENEKSNECDRTFSFNMNLCQIGGADFGEIVAKRSR